jgi:lipopolysaccharide export system permease protein
MQFVWLVFDDLAGKGITMVILFKYIYYIIIIAVPRAIPIAILLASIMTMGNLSENYEYAAIKSAGISLQRLLIPLFVIVTLLSFVNLYFLNYAFPWAVLKQKNISYNIKKHKPALALVEGTFNSDIPGYVIKFDEKYGEEKNKLKNVLIYKTNVNNGSINTITAERGTIATEENSKYMRLLLEDGYYYQEHWNRGSKKKDRQKMPFSKTHFDQYTVNIDISSFNTDDLDKEKNKSDREMLSFKQLRYFSDSLKTKFDESVNNRAKTIDARVKSNKLQAIPDSLKQKIEWPILSNFDTKAQVKILESATGTLNRSIDNLTSFSKAFTWKRKQLNLIDTESHKRVALAFSALLLFLIGAPLGALIRKGGFGLPMVLAILIYLAFHFISTFAGNMAETSTIDNKLGGWLSTIILLPLGVYLTYRATRDKGMINLSPIINAFERFLNFFTKKR